MAVITLPAPRRTNWAPGTRTGVVGGIYQYRPGGANQRVTQVNVVTYGADPTGVADSGPAIRLAIAACATGQVVWFPAGLYLIASSISVPVAKKNITFRGEGIGLSKLVIQGNVTIGTGSNSDYQWLYPSSNNQITGGLVQGATELTIASTAAFSVGQLISLQIENEADDAQIMAGAAPNFSVAGFAQTRRPKHRVVSKTATTLTIEPPIYFPVRAGLSVLVKAAQLQGEGVGWEDLEIDCALCTNAFPFSFAQCVNCWVYRVKVTTTANYHIGIDSCLHMEVRQCWLDGRRSGGTNGAALLYAASSAGLVEHTVLARNFPCVEVNFGSCGNAFVHSVFERQAGVSGGMINSNHAPHNSHNIYEANISPNLQCDGYFGSASDDTVFRNWFHGAIADQSSTTFTFSLNRFTRNYNVLGNILGWSGYKNGSMSFGNPNLGNSAFSGSAQPTTGDFWNDWKATATITTRAGDTAGTMTLNSGALAVGQLCYVIWGVTAHSTPNRFQFTVPTGGVAGNVITITAAAGTALPIVGTAVQVFTGPSGYQETDQPDCEGSTFRRGNYFALATGGGSIPLADALGGDTLPDSLIFDSQPSDWPSGFAWPPFDPTDPITSQSFSRLPAGVWLTTGVWPGDTPAAPAITLNPVSQTVETGNTVTFSANASGVPTPSWTWAKNGVPISGQTTRFLTLTNVNESSEGSYTATATNTQGSATTSAATLVVNEIIVPDTTPPFPNPSTIALAVPNTYAQITVTADLALDASGFPVEYNFSVDDDYQGWQSSNVFVATGLVPSTTYYFAVKVRDNVGNETSPAAPIPATTLPAIVYSKTNPMGHRGSRNNLVLVP